MFRVTLVAEEYFKGVLYHSGKLITFFSPTGEITSPGYPKEYPPDKECLWMIVAPPDYKIILTFNHLDIEGKFTACNSFFLM